MGHSHPRGRSSRGPLVVEKGIFNVDCTYLPEDVLKSCQLTIAATDRRLYKKQMTICCRVPLLICLRHAPSSDGTDNPKDDKLHKTCSAPAGCSRRSAKATQVQSGSYKHDKREARLRSCRTISSPAPPGQSRGPARRGYGVVGCHRRGLASLAYGKTTQGRLRIVLATRFHATYRRCYVGSPTNARALLERRDKAP